MKCDICNREPLPEDYGYKINMKSLNDGSRISAFCCSGCFFAHFRKGVIAIGDGAYTRNKAKTECIDDITNEVVW